MLVKIKRVGCYRVLYAGRHEARAGGQAHRLEVETPQLQKYGKLSYASS